MKLHLIRLESTVESTEPHDPTTRLSNEPSPRHLRRREYREQESRLLYPGQYTHAGDKIVGEVAARYLLPDLRDKEFLHVTSAEKDYRIRPGMREVFDPHRNKIT